MFFVDYYYGPQMSFLWSSIFTFRSNINNLDYFFYL